jgi:Tn3 transposase DDE domain
VTAAIVLWKHLLSGAGDHALRTTGKLKDESLLRFLAPLGWEHINLTGDYVWRLNRKSDEGQFRPLRRHENP